MEWLALARRHDEVHGDALQRHDLVIRVLGNHDVRGIPGQRPGPVRVARGGFHRPAEAADQIGRNVLKLCQRFARTIEICREQILSAQSHERGQQLVGIPLRPIPCARLLDDVVQHLRIGEHNRIERAGGDGILDVMHGVGDIIRKVHDLAFHGLGSLRRADLEPSEYRLVIRVDAEYLRPLPLWVLVGFGQGPRVFDGRVQGRTGQVHAGRTPVRVKDLGFEPGQDTHGLCVAFEAADIAGDVGERTLPIVPERRVTKVVGQTGAVDHVRITAEQCADLATDLGDFQRMRQSSASEIVGTGNQNLAFRAQTPQSGRMNQSRAIALERGA